MAKAPIYKGKTFNGDTVIVGKLVLEDHTYYIQNDELNIKEQIRLKSLSTATKKEYSTFVKSFNKK